VQDFLNLTHQQALGWRVSKIIVFVILIYDSDMICCKDLFLAWFSRYDFDIVSACFSYDCGTGFETLSG
jgi:hypothetical protein